MEELRPTDVDVTLIEDDGLLEKLVGLVEDNAADCCLEDEVVDDENVDIEFELFSDPKLVVFECIVLLLEGTVEPD